MKRLITHLIITSVVWGLAGASAPASGTLSAHPVTGKFPESGAPARAVHRGRKPNGPGKLQAAQGQAAATENKQPLTQQQLLELIAAKMPNQRIFELLRDRGIDFQVTDDLVSALRKAGANEPLIVAVRDASAKTAGVLVETSPHAQVFLDGTLRGQADDQGVIAFRAKLGPHALKISLAGKQDFQQNINVAEKQSTRVVALLADLGGTVRIKAPTGATVWLDNSVRGTMDSSGELLLKAIPAGTHALRVTAPGKVDDLHTLTVTAGAETSVGAALLDTVQLNPRDSLKYVWIAPGDFMMGCSLGDNDCADPEKPPHRVTLLKAFWMGQTEVTVGAYKHYAGAAGTRMPPVSPKSDHGWRNVNLPIVDITWDEANQYCTWIGGRLPSEAEWEYAARGGSTQPRYGNLSDIAWTKENAGNQTHVVGGKQANGFGLFDMLGNVWEWVNDWYDPNYYKNSPDHDPPGPAAGQERALRGGAWIVDAKLLRASDRYSLKPDVRSNFFGFRCVWTPKTP